MPIIGDESTAILKMHGMNIAGRTEMLSLAFGKLYGVLQIDINYISDNMSIKYNPRKVTIDQIRKIIGDGADLANLGL